jgi:hypothetical protein
MTQNTKPNDHTTKPSTKQPNETGTVRVEGFVRIFDPKTQQVFVEKRA